MAVVPYKQRKSSKKLQVKHMFNNISHHYDFLNHFLSLGIDIVWRRKAIALLKKTRPKLILDVATGTGDFAIEALRLNPDKIIGVDIAEKMLDKGRAKLKEKGVEEKVELCMGDAEALPFKDETFDAAIIAFGVRNFENLEKGLAEIQRVLQRNGVMLILELSKPTIFPFNMLYNFYFRYILPIIGRWVTKDRSAYTYLPASVQAFPQGTDFLTILQQMEWKTPQCIPLTLGVSSIYLAQK
ncbi:MAG: bifunctional demethylmenaquinone methyltransferase/2-methoxy-6-polyprenyl-1,4-benzoquinol methylase UbiE [Cytophagales bacterium]|nr:bifunctional demethylmenaquinone methyltransferase/2-methoxy-6-polyprenyl-1,4-benzoquinol methylase UbiE [Cytophagales bacterium]